MMGDGRALGAHGDDKEDIFQADFSDFVSPYMNGMNLNICAMILWKCLVTHRIRNTKYQLLYSDKIQKY